jgi:intracellular sulfur oxidation DsrE/DsrF family protein
MKSIIFLISLLSFSSLLQAQKDYKVVFDLTSRDSVDHKNVVRWINEITASEPNANLEVVLYGKSLDMVTKDKSVVSNAVQQLAAKPNVAFKVCAIAMKNNNVDKAQLIPGVQVVPDGIYEIIGKQKEGWGYIKASH